MKLYYNPQAASGERWELPGQQAKKADRVDVPDRAPDLAAWLNGRQVLRDAWSVAGLTIEPQLASGPELWPGEAAEHAAADASGPSAAAKVPGHCDACGRSAAGTFKLAIGADVDALEAWADTIQHDNLWALGRAAEIIRDRARELGAQWAERTVQ